MRTVAVLIVLPAALLNMACNVEKPPADYTFTRPGPPQDPNLRRYLEIQTEAFKMRAEQAAELEALLVREPDNLDARLRLLIFYGRPDQKALPEEEIRNRRKELVLYLISNHPQMTFEPFTFPSWTTQISPKPWEPHPDPEGYRQARELWLKQTRRFPDNAQVQINGAAFFLFEDKRLAEGLLLRARELDPSPRTAYLLGDLYSQILVGSNASMPGGVVRSVSLTDAHGPYAAEVKNKLLKSRDSWVLFATVRNLCRSADLYRRKVIDFDPIELAEALTNRLKEIDPQGERTLTLDRILKRQRQSERLQAVLGSLRAPQERVKLMSIPEQDRYELLPLYITSGVVSSSPDQYALFANEVLRLAAQDKSETAATRRFDAHIALAKVALVKQDKREAVRQLHAAAQESGIPRNHPLSFELQRHLLMWKQHDAVAEFLEALAQHHERAPELRAWAGEIRKGKYPPMGPFLNRL